MSHNEKKHTCPCLTVCPVGAISVDKKTNLIKIDQDKCIGCGSCVAVCETGAISINPETGKAQVNHDICHRTRFGSGCDENCKCGCQEGKECTHGDNCTCDKDCDCGCNQGKKHKAK